MSRRTTPLVLAGLLAAAGTAQAGPKPVTMAFTVVGLAPHPVGVGSCAGGDRHVVALRLKSKGGLVAELDTYAGDYDMVLTDGNGLLLARGRSNAPSAGKPSLGETSERLRYAIPRAATVKLVVCNYLGAPYAAGRLTFTPTR